SDCQNSAVACDYAVLIFRTRALGASGANPAGKRVGDHALGSKPWRIVHLQVFRALHSARQFFCAFAKPWLAAELEESILSAVSYAFIADCQSELANSESTLATYSRARVRRSSASSWALSAARSRASRSAPCWASASARCRMVCCLACSGASCCT